MRPLIQVSCSELMIASEFTDFVFRFYNDALVAACDQGLFGLFVMLVSASICALFFTILVWCNSHTWIYFKHKGKYVKVNLNPPNEISRVFN